MKHTMHKMIFILFIAASIDVQARGAGADAVGMQGQGMSQRQAGPGQMQHDHRPQHQVSPRQHSENFQSREIHPKQQPFENPYMYQERHQIRQTTPDSGFEYQQQYRNLNQFGQEK